MPEHPGSIKTLPPARHETSDVPVRIGLLGFVLAAVALAAAILLPAWLFPASRPPTPASAIAASPGEFAAPRLQPSPHDDMQAFLAAETARLNGTGWIDKTSGTVHVPIDDAMQAIARKGIADWPKPPAGGEK